ncbi:ROK family transcriptional regulator [Bacillus changyiensis]|uniref:ROK family transcriptional regulator n=1 Tax=Bacillus changyiensis TaxID=3004103 RepID=UPI0022DEA9FC|nr:ROK family transcriptional regulator [Bacillus changyiensis]MDA1476328.1 ROK family transcriptional regulator [Bacillus changyiensis]
MRKVILRDIRKSLLELESATKVELSEKLGISFPTISKFLSQMEKSGELFSAGLDDSSGGRRAKRYTYNPEYMLGLAIFLERTETHYIVFNCLGEVKDTGKTSSVLVEDDLRSLTQYVEDILGKYSKISSIAIGVPGSVDNGRIFYIPGYEHLQNFDLKGYLEDRFSIPVVVENDMNAAVLGYHDRKGMKNKSLIYLYSGQNGPGAGIMVNGVVVRGSTNFSGEISFVPQDGDRNFRRALENESGEVDAISRLVASFVAILNPHTMIFCDDEVNQLTIDRIVKQSSKYIPTEHLPEFKISEWKQDYLFGLQSLGFDLMVTEISS